MEAEVLQQDDAADGGVFARGLDVGPPAVLEEEDVPAQLLLQLLSDGGQGVLVLSLSVRPPEVAHQHHGLGPALQRRPH